MALSVAEDSDVEIYVVELCLQFYLAESEEYKTKIILHKIQKFT